MIQLTNEQGDKFYLNVELIERIEARLYRGGSAVYLTTGRWVECVEQPEAVADLVRKVWE